MEVTLRDRSIFKGDFPVKRRCETVNNPALHLRFEPIGVHGQSGVRRASDVQSSGFAIGHINGDDLRANRAKAFND